MPAEFPRYLTVEEAADLLDVSDARVSWWIGEGRLPIAARSEYAGFLLRTHIVETVGRRLAEATPAELRMSGRSKAAAQEKMSGPLSSRSRVPIKTLVSTGRSARRRPKHAA